MKRGEIWHVDLDPTKGSEQQGKRYVLIVSADAFNRASRLAVVCPITAGGEWARARGFSVPLATAGTRTTGVVLVHQLRTVDLQARGGQKVECVPQEVIDDVLARIQTFLGDDE